MLREAFEHAPVAMIVVNGERIIQMMNDEAVRLFGYAKDELVGRATIERLVPEASRSKHPALVGGYMVQPAHRAMGKGRNLFGQRKDGTLVPIEVGLRPFQTEEGLFVMSSIIDISERQRAEDRFRAAFEAAPNAMIMVDQTGTIVLTNDQTTQLFGYEAEELAGKPIEALVPEESRGHHPQWVQGFLRNPRPRAMGTGRVLKARRKDGSLFPVEIGLRPFQGADGSYVISSVVDISEIVRVRERLTERNEELEQFAYRTSHDLKAPLISIQGLSRCIAEDIADGETGEATANAQKIAALSGRLQGLISDILALMKSEYIHEPAKEVDFRRILEHAQESLQTLLREHDVSLESDLRHSSELHSQRIRVEQVVENLVSNGIKYSDAGKERRYVRVSTREEAGTFIIEVRDNGLGIPTERHGEVFSLFKRFHAQSHYGSGLGLYLVKKHVQKLRGEISFSSDGEGTCFYVRIPNDASGLAAPSSNEADAGERPLRQ